MRVFRLAESSEVLVFDLDMTLYRSAPYINHQERVLLTRLAERLGQREETVLSNVEAIQGQGPDPKTAKLPLSTVLSMFGITVEENVRWREDLFRPEEYLNHDQQLGPSLRRLRSKFKLAVVTNSPTTVAHRVLTILGADDCFDSLVGVDISKASKPSIIPFEMVRQEFGVAYSSMVSIGDRYSVDLEIPLQYGMGAILVECMQDVYDLPGVLLESIGDVGPAGN